MRELKTPEQIIAAMAEVYAGCASCRDSGSVLTRHSYFDGRRDSSEKRPFTTAFVRPDRFRFASRLYLAPGNTPYQYIVCLTGETVQCRWALRPEWESPESLSMAIAGATGVSGPSAHTIPALLMPRRVEVLRLTDLTELTRLSNEDLDGEECYRIQGRLVVDPAAEERCRKEFARRTGRPPGARERSPDHLWIERTRLLLRKLERRTRFETFQTETVMTYEPSVDVSISEEELRFDPHP
jgi:hypothetical protein